MSIITYALLCYGLTAGISLLAIAVVLGINGLVDRAEENAED